MRIRPRLTGVIAATAAVTLLAAGCGSSDDAGTTSAAAPPATSAAASGDSSAPASGGADLAGKRACVMLPDADSSSRWENGDRPALEKGFTDLGMETDIQNALNDTSKYATLADQQLTQGCDVMLLVDLNGAGVQVATKAKAQGIPVIAYDRPIAGADIYISFDNFRVGELQGQMLVDAMNADGTDIATANIVYVGGDPTDGNAKQFHDGADSVLKAAGMPKPAFETPGAWSAEKSGTAFEQALTALQGKVDAVWAANDINAGAVIQVLDKNGLTIPVSGQDASPIGLQNVLLGKQSATVYKPFQLEAASAVEVAQQLIAGETPTTDMKDTTGVPFIAQEPIITTNENMQQVFDDGNAKVSEVCTGEIAAKCTEAGIS
jgi:D-xylose transport system substrate-binding protein